MPSLNRISVLVIFCSALVIECSDKEEPVYPIEPHIEFVSVEFEEDESSQRDSLNLVLSFTDGDNDFGFDETDLAYRSDPFHLWYFFQEDDKDLNPLTTTTFSFANDYYIILNIDQPEKGKLVFPRTRKKQGYENLPVLDCANYTFVPEPANLLVSEEDAHVLDAFTTIIDTLLLGTSEYYHVVDTFMVEINRDHFNIEVDFLVDNGDGFEVFDWYEEFCFNFHGRVFANCTNTCVTGPFKMKKFNKGSGELIYSMKSAGFKYIFGDKKVKLRVSIKDRALHKSNIIETPEFRLSDI